MKVLIIGLGSIAKRHTQALHNNLPQVTIYALRSSPTASSQTRIHNLFAWEDVPEDLDFILISNPTSEHLSTIHKCLSFNVPLFIEKPPLMNLDGSAALIQAVNRRKVSTYTAFNMRFHPLLKWLKQHLILKKVLEVSVYCGSYLPDWRPDTDYRISYSSSAKMGGGVHLDLIHELDYVKWIFGAAQEIQGNIDKVSKLEINSADYAHYNLIYPEMHITILLNYYRKKPKRTLEIVLDDDIWQVDLILNKIIDSEGKILFDAPQDVQKIYNDQMEYFTNTLQTGKAFMNQLPESLETLADALKIKNRHA